MSALRIALLDRTEGGYSRELETALRASGHETRLFGDRAIPVAEALLGRRGFTPALSHIPPTVFELLRGEFDLVHSFSAPDAAAAFAWRRMSGRPIVFTCTEVLERGTLADGRLRFASIAGAFEDSDAVVAASDKIRNAAERWLACSPEVIAAGDGNGYGRVYGALVA